VRATLERRVEVLFAEDELARLRSYAAAQRASVGEIVREAVRRQILEPDEAARLQAVADLTSGELGLDWPEWAELEAEMSRDIVRDLEAD
jgi:hypothetical protein